MPYHNRPSMFRSDMFVAETTVNKDSGNLFAGSEYLTRLKPLNQLSSVHDLNVTENEGRITLDARLFCLFVQFFNKLPWKDS